MTVGKFVRYFLQLVAVISTIVIFCSRHNSYNFKDEAEWEVYKEITRK